MPRFLVRNLAQGGQFNGTDNYISLATSSSLQVTKFSLAAWINFKSIPSTNAYIFNASASNFYLFWNGTGFTYGFQDVGSTYHDSGFAYKPNISTWMHIIYTYDQVNRTLFINGLQVDQQAQTAVPSTGGNQTYYVMAFSAGTNFFPGWGVDFILYNAALSVQDCANLCFTGSTSVDATALKCQLLLNEASGTSATDNSGNSNTGTWGGTTTSIHTSTMLPPFWGSRTLAT